VEAGSPPADVCRQLGCSEASFYIWKKRHGNLGITEIKELRQLRDENARLKRVVADHTLDKHILSEVVRKNSKAGTTARAGGIGSVRGIRSRWLDAWSARELKAVRSLARAGIPSGRVAKKLGRTAAAVQQKAMRAGISFRAAKRSGARRKKK
jgi:putative transposase